MRKFLISNRLPDNKCQYHKFQAIEFSKNQSYLFDQCQQSSARKSDPENSNFLISFVQFWLTYKQSNVMEREPSKKQFKILNYLPGKYLPSEFALAVHLHHEENSTHSQDPMEHL